tara:strand:- start:13562 stop:14218 length:657 start_codon:yes stop_codon:yes gene_type:complete
LKQSEPLSVILKYFPDLSFEQINQLETLERIYIKWNQKINVISRKDLDQFYTHHVLHSLSIAKFISFKENTKLLDVGTGGGFPGIPLAIYFKKCSFTLIDSIGKKIKVVNEVKSELKLNNVNTFHQRAEKNQEKYDFIVSRAVTHLSKFCPWVVNNISIKNNNDIENGIIYLKGGDLREEINSISKKFKYSTIQIQDFFNEQFFNSKVILHLYKKQNN